MQEETKIFIISLKKSIDRRHLISENFNKLSEKIDYQFFDAIYGKEQPEHTLFKKYNSSKRYARKGNYLNESQLGCLASHWLLWNKCVELNEPMIILEDDAILKNNFIEVYHFIHSKNNIYEFFYLSQNNSKKQNSKLRYQFPNSKTNLSQFFGGWGNTTGYFITPKAAYKLLNVTKEWIYESDVTIDRYWESGIDYCGISPPAIMAGNFESNIPINKGKKNLLTKCRREFYKLLDYFNKWIFDNFKRDYRNE